MMTQADAKRVAEIHNATGGCTWSCVDGDLRGHSGYAVGRHSRATAVYRRCITAAMVMDAWEFIGKPGLIGTWHDQEHGRSVMERITLHATKDKAIARAVRENSRYIFDLANGRVIPVQAAA